VCWDSQVLVNVYPKTAQQRASRQVEKKDASRPKSQRLSSKLTEVVTSVVWRKSVQDHGKAST
jgi:hypothetical protein